MNDTTNRKFWNLSVLAIILAVLTWVAAWAVVANSSGMIVDPVGEAEILREAEKRARALLIFKVSMVTFAVLLVFSSWLAGLTATNGRITTYLVFSIHGAAVLTIFLMMYLQ